MARKNSLSPRQVKVLIIGGAGLALLWYLSQRQAQTASNQTPDSLAFNIARNVTNIPVQAANDIVTGGVVGIGQGIGIPPTSLDKCAMDRANGDVWNASFDCPAFDFLSWWWNK